MSNEVVSRRVVVKAHKRGRVRSVHSPEAQADAATSTHIEETPTTRAYVKPLGFAPPPAPSLDVAPPPRYITVDWPSHGRDARMCMPASVFIIALAVVLLTSILFHIERSRAPLYARLDNISWHFRGHVCEPRRVMEADWHLPSGAHVLDSQTRQRTTQQVLDRVEQHCWPAPEVVHYEPHRVQERVAWQRCEERKMWRTDPVMGTWWTYEVERCVRVKTVQLNAELGHAPDDVQQAIAGTNQTYESHEWTTLLYFSGNVTKTVVIKRPVFEDYWTHIGHIILVP